MHHYCSFTPFFRSYTCCLAIQFDDEIAVHWLAIAVHVQLFMVMATLISHHHCTFLKYADVPAVLCSTLETSRPRELFLFFIGLPYFFGLFFFFVFLYVYTHGATELYVVTDHQPLKWLLDNKAAKSAQHLRWALMVSEYEFKVLHRPGITHQNADARRIVQATAGKHCGCNRRNRVGGGD